MSIRPQSGPQTAFLASSADIAIYGGAAGGGKSWALLMEPLRHVANPQFAAVLFRRNMTNIVNPGGLWDAAMALYSRYPAATPRMSLPMRWQFPSGARVTFAHLEAEATVLSWQGAEIPLIGFDEMTHFSKAQFFYMLSRNRSTCGVRPYIRATCNPDADSWVADFIAWWIEPNTGLPIPERSGVIRYFVRDDDRIVWADRAEDLPAQMTPDGQIVAPKSATFVAAKLTDNAALMAADPGYYANLLSLPTVERERLLAGNWKIRPKAGMYFQRQWCGDLLDPDEIPAGLRATRYWDLAATSKTEDNDPDWTIGVKMARDDAGRFYVLDVRRLREDPYGVEQAIRSTASADGKGVEVGLPRDPAAAGKMQADYFVRQFAGYMVRAEPETGDKVTRFGPVSSQTRAGNIRVTRGPWNEAFFNSLEGFPEATHDDDADALAGAFRMLTEAPAPVVVTDATLAQARAMGSLHRRHF